MKGWHLAIVAGVALLLGMLAGAKFPKYPALVLGKVGL